METALQWVMLGMQPSCLHIGGLDPSNPSACFLLLPCNFSMGAVISQCQGFEEIFKIRTYLRLQRKCLSRWVCYWKTPA